MENSDKINVRNNWLKIGVVSVVTLVIAYKITTADFSGIEFSFSELLALLLSFFAISISISFYFQTNKTSNRFYDNTYRFTKDISENLGRIEERFGEQLEGIKEGSKALSDRVERFYVGDNNTEVEEKKTKELQEKLEKKIKQQSAILDEFVTKYKIESNDKESFIKGIGEKNNEIEKLKRKINLINHPSSIDRKKYNFLEIPSKMIRFYLKRMKINSELDLSQLNYEDSKSRFEIFKESLASGFMSDMVIYDMYDEDGLTMKGKKLLDEIIKNESFSG
jgi:hypothetical protein